MREHRDVPGHGRRGMRTVDRDRVRRLRGQESDSSVVTSTLTVPRMCSSAAKA